MRKKTLFVILVIISVLPLLSLLTPGFPLTHDGQDHIARIANFYQSLSEGNLVPRWAANLNWGFGHPVIMFLYPFPSYIASLFHSFGLSLVDSYKLVFASTYLASIVIMFIFISRMIGVQEGFVAALLYGFAPYRFVDMYVRGAVGEHTAFIFAPLLFWGLWELSREKEYVGYAGILVSIGFFGLMISHNAAIIMIAPLAILYLLYLYLFESKNPNRFIISSLAWLGVGFGLSAFFWIPAFFEGKYTLRDIVTGKEAATRTISMVSVIYSPWNYLGGAQFTKQLGVIHWIIVIVTVSFVSSIRDNKIKVRIIGLLLSLACSIIIMSHQSKPLWEWFSLIQKFQFPWRFLWLTTFIMSLIGVHSIGVMNKRYRNIFIVFVVIGLVVSTFSMWKPKAYQVQPEQFFTGVYSGTTDTGESSPIWSVRFMEHRAAEPIGIISGVAQIRQEKTNTTTQVYSIDASTDVRLVKNTLYFPGWNVYIDERPTSVEFQDPEYRGLMTFHVPKGKHIVRFVFGETKLRKVSNIISLISLVIFVPYLYVLRKGK